MSDNNKQQPWVMAIPVVSTAHLAEGVRLHLDAVSAKAGVENRSAYGLYMAPSPHGYFIACGEDGDDDDLPESLAAPLRWARQTGYEWVRFDSDGDVIAGVPTYK